MDRLWAPWRKAYVSGEAAGEGCLFCRLLSESDDRGNLVLARGEHFFAVLNRYPYTNGHLMIVPNRHVPLFSDLGPSEGAALLAGVSAAERAFSEVMRCGGINGGWNVGRCAGAGVEGHLHLHVLPRWPGDVNFLPATADTRVLSESLESSYERLLPFFEGIS